MRRSGRTSTMLNEAVDLARAGEDVIIVVANETHRSYIVSELKQYYGVSAISVMIGVVTFKAAVIVKTIHDNDVEMDSRRVRGTNCKVLFDHYALEAWEAILNNITYLEE